MFRKKDEELQVPEPEAPHEETAYEDNWYRSLKAMREHEEVGGSEADKGPDAADGATGSGAADAGGEATDDAHAEELEARAGQLLERLHTLQHLVDEPPAEPEPKRSVWG
jgi:hypothetical protein